MRATNDAKLTNYAAVTTALFSFSNRLALVRTYGI